MPYNLILKDFILILYYQLEKRIKEIGKKEKNFEVY